MVVRDRYGSTTHSLLQKVTAETVGAVLNLVLTEDALLCTDGSTVYKALAKSEAIEHHALVASKGKGLHIQNVNTYDSRLKGSMLRLGLPLNISQIISDGVDCLKNKGLNFNPKLIWRLLFLGNQQLTRTESSFNILSV